MTDSPLPSIDMLFDQFPTGNSSPGSRSWGMDEFGGVEGMTIHPALHEDRVEMAENYSEFPPASFVAMSYHEWLAGPRAALEERILVPAEKHFVVMAVADIGGDDFEVILKRVARNAPELVVTGIIRRDQLPERQPMLLKMSMVGMIVVVLICDE